MSVCISVRLSQLDEQIAASSAPVLVAQSGTGASTFFREWFGETGRLRSNIAQLEQHLGAKDETRVIGLSVTYDRLIPGTLGC
jgi:hypothetical protein